MHCTLYQIYRRTSQKYKKLSHRLEKSIVSGRFWRESKYRQNQLVSRVDKIRLKLERLELQLKMAIAGGLVIAGFSGTFNEAAAQNPGLGPYTQINDRSSHPLPRPLTWDPIDEAYPSFANFDGDSDIDLFITLHTETYISYANWLNDVFVYTDRFEAIGRHFGLAGGSNPFAPGIYGVRGRRMPEFVDIDNDGDLDLFSNNGDPFCGPYEPIFLYNNSGTFENRTLDPSNPFDDELIGIAAFSFVDLDGDGDFDAFAGDQFYRNDGNASVGNFNSYGMPIYYPGTIEHWVFFDSDGDGDLDAIGSENGELHFFRNLNGNAIPPFEINNWTEADNDPRFTNLDNVNFGSEAIPKLVDIDYDGDQDLIVMATDPGGPNPSTEFITYLNDGTNYFYRAAQLTNPFGGVDVGDEADLVWGDIDGDGDQDLLIGSSSHGVFTYLQEDTGAGQYFLPLNGPANPLDFTNTLYNTSPALADMDNDGDLDAYIGTNNALQYHYNIGTGAHLPNFAPNNPTNSLLVALGSTLFNNDDYEPALGDLDGDGDIDAFINNGYDCCYNMYQFNNNGTVSAANFAVGPQFPYFVGYRNITLVDVDHDSDLDIVTGSQYSDIQFIEDWDGSWLRKSNSYHPFDSFYDPISSPSFTDIDGDGDLDFFLGEKYGQVRFYRNNNQPPAITIDGTDIDYDENDPSTPIDAVMNVSDPDANDNMVWGGTVTVSGYVNGEDVLAYSDEPDITEFWDSASGVLTLSDTATVTEYRNLLRSITYENLSHDPTTTPRDIIIELRDTEFTDPIPVQRRINVASINDPPQAIVGDVTGSIFTEDGAPVPVDNLFLASDLDHANLTGATIQFSGGFVTGQDELLFTNQLGISGSYNGGTGILTLTGSATVANYQAAIRTVTYRNTSQDPDVTVRNFQIILDDGVDPSAASNHNLIVNAVNDEPTLAATAGNVTYFPTDPPEIIDPGITITDPDDTDITGAIIEITQNYVQGDDVLLFTNQLGITGTFDAPTGQLTLTGTTTLANYQTALRSIQFQNNNLATSSAIREVSFSVRDALIVGPVETRSIQIGDNPPVVNITSTALGYTENDGPVAVDPTLTLTDDTPNLTSATITLTGFASAEDLLDFTSTGGITGSYSAGTGTLSLTGSATVADYQTVLQSITYENTSDDPSTSARSVNFVVNDGFNASSTATRSISLTAVNDAPSVSLTVSSGTYNENDPALTLNNFATVTDPDNTSLSQITVTITNYQTGEDELTSAPSGSVSGSFDTVAGSLTISGTGSITEFETVLRSVGYQNTSEDPDVTPRGISILANDGTDASTAQTYTVNVVAINDAPVVAGSGTALDHNGGSSIVDPNINVVDVDNASLSSAQVTISSGLKSGTDILGFTPQGSITGSYNSTTGILSFTGTGTVAEYNAILASVTYQNTLGIDSSTRTIQFSVNDGTDGSNVFSRTINVDISDLPPVLTLTTTSFTYTENAGPQTIDPGATITDDTPQLVGALVSITSDFVSGEDLLGFTDQSGITGTYDSTTGILALTGSATPAQYQTALGSLTYENTSDDPGNPIKTIEIQLDDGINTSIPVSMDVQISPVNDAPEVTGSTGDVSYRSLTGTVVVDDQITLADLDDTDVVGAIISVASDYVSGEDFLYFTDQNGITGNFNPVTGILSLSGTRSLAVYQDALRTITYENLAPVPSASSKSISFVVSDQTLQSAAFERTIQIATNQVIASEIDSDVDIGADVTVDVISQATFTPGDIITTTITGAPTQGTAVVNPDGSITYTPNNDVPNGTIDPITYELCNEFLSCGSSTINVTVNNEEPQVSSELGTVQQGGRVTIPVTVVDENWDGNIIVSSDPVSGVEVTVNPDGSLNLDYAGSGFQGVDFFKIEVCDLSGACSIHDIEIEVGEVDEVLVFNAVTPNNDGIHDFLKIPAVHDIFPNNEIFIYNKIGKLVYNVTGYNNNDVVFEGYDNNGDELPDGTYYYVIYLEDGKRQGGYIILQR